MIVSDVRFAAELVTKKGRVYKFDDIHCMVTYLKTYDLEAAEVKDYYLTNFSGSHQLMLASKAMLLKSDVFKSPMGGNIAAFDNADSLAAIQKKFTGNTISWNDLIKP